ncbi:MAG TPA: hypothetical protein VHW24_21060 [Bryobacteraceae bacterium]|nr:hypothetical protein [Bryobacteraceae bacterium]
MALIEYRGEDPTVPIRPEHKMTVAQVRSEGFRFVKSIKTLPRQHIIVSVKKTTDLGYPTFALVASPFVFHPRRARAGTFR